MALWLLSGPFMLKKVADETASPAAADVFAASVPFLLAFLNVYTVVIVTTDLESYDQISHWAKKLSLLLFPLLWAVTALFKRGISWMKAQVGDDREEVLGWTRVGVLFLFVYGLATFV